MSAFATTQQHNALSHRVDQNGRRISNLEETFAFVKDHLATKEDLKAHPTRDEMQAFVAKTKYDILDHMDRRFNEVDQRFASIDKRFEKIDRRFVKIDKRFSQMDNRFSSMDVKIDVLDQKFDALDQKVDLIINKLDKQ